MTFSIMIRVKPQNGMPSEVKASSEWKVGKFQKEPYQTEKENGESKVTYLRRV